MQCIDRIIKKGDLRKALTQSCHIKKKREIASKKGIKA